MAATRARTTPRKRPRQERSQALVEVLLEAAARVFVKEGYAKATTNRIAAAAGVSVGSLYQYFPSKDALAVELLRRYREGLAQRVASSLAEATRETFAGLVQKLLLDLLRGGGLDPTLHRVLIEQVLRTSARREMIGFEEKLEEVIGEALRVAEVDLPDREIAAFVLVRVVLAVVQGVVVDRPRYKTPEMAAELTRLITRYVGAPGPR